MSKSDLSDSTKEREAEEAAKPPTKPVARVLQVFIGPIGRDVRSEDRKVPSFVLPLTPALALKRAFALGGTSASLKDSTLPTGDGDEPFQLLTLDRFPWALACKEAMTNPDCTSPEKSELAVRYLRKGIQDKLEGLGFEVEMSEWAPPRAQPKVVDSSTTGMKKVKNSVFWMVFWTIWTIVGVGLIYEIATNPPWYGITVATVGAVALALIVYSQRTTNHPKLDPEGCLKAPGIIGWGPREQAEDLLQIEQEGGCVPCAGTGIDLESPGENPEPCPVCNGTAFKPRS